MNYATWQRHGRDTELEQAAATLAAAPGVPYAVDDLDDTPQPSPNRDDATAAAACRMLDLHRNG